MVSFGEKIKQMREDRGWSHDRLAAKSGLSKSRLISIEKMDRPTVHGSTLEKLAGAFETTVLLLRGTNGNGHSPAAPAGHSVAKDNFGPSNIAPYSERSVGDVPRIKGLSVAAADWVYTQSDDDTGQQFTPAQLRAGKFEIEISGNCMEPALPDKTIIEFQVLRDSGGAPELSNLEVGKFYYIQLSDGRATFKKLDRVEPHELILSCLNTKMRKKLTAPIEEITRIAVAKRKVEDL